MKKKIFAVILGALMAIGAVGCGGTPIGEEVDVTKTQLYVGNYNGGVGTAWLEETAARFEDLYKDVCFEPGTDKKGVQIMIDADKQRFHGDNLLNNISSIPEQVIFTERVFYDDYVASGKIYDMTDVVTGDMSEWGETGTIEDKIGAAQKDLLNRDGKYYAVPHYRLFSGIQYNVKLWEDEGYYFAREGGFVSPGSTPETEPRGLGPDGKTGVVDGVDCSLDDGLPATYDEFFELCDYICETGNVPFTWTGEHLAQYTGYLYWALYADFEGEARLMPNFDFTGTVDDIIDGWNADGTPIVKRVDITRQNGYELRQQLGRYYALSFLERIVRGNPARKFTYYHNRAFGLTYSHLNAQEDFIKSYYENAPVAMLLEGSWWENEADAPNGAFQTAAQEYGAAAGRKNSKFGFMPLPKATREEVGKPFTTVDVYDSYIVFNANLKGKPDQIALAERFAKFCCTREEMAKFTQSTGLPKSLSYTMTDAEIEPLTHYEKQLWNTNRNGAVVLPYSSDKLYRNNLGTLRYTYDWMTTVGGRPYGIPVKAYKDDKVTARQYFDGMKMTAAAWNNLYSKDF